jgi:hypothetical protein
VNREKAKLVVLSSFEEKVLEPTTWEEDVQSQIYFPALNSLTLEDDCLKLSNSGKYPGIFTKSPSPSISVFENIRSEFFNLGYLLLANDPYKSLDGFSPFTQAVALSFKAYSNKKHDVEVVSYRYFRWMESQGASWSTTCMDILGALPRFNWVSVNADILESITVEDFKKTLEIFIQDRIIVGFDIYNVVMSDAVNLCEELSTSLLISQGRISKDRYLKTSSRRLPIKPSGLLPVQTLTP